MSTAKPGTAGSPPATSSAAASAKADDKATGAPAAAKKKAVAKKKSAAPVSKAPPLTVEEQNLLLLRKVESLQHTSIQHNYQHQQHEAEVQQLRQRCLSLQAELQQERQDHVAIVSEVTRYHQQTLQTVQHQLQHTTTALNERETQIQTLQSELLAYKQRSDELCHMKDLELQEQHCRMDEMVKEFGLMLKSTLERMNEKIVVTNTNQAYTIADSMLNEEKQQADSLQHMQINTYDDLTLISKK